MTPSKDSRARVGTTRGAVVAAHQAAADAGAGALASGGTVIDATVAAAFVLAVVEPWQCGLGGYGGFLTYAQASGDTTQVNFNTWVPARLGASVLQRPGADVPLLDGGRAVAPPMVVPGLLAAHESFGRLPLQELLIPAVRLARDGFTVGPGLARALADHWERTAGGTTEFATIFYPTGKPPEPGERLVQADLAVTLESLSRESFRSGRIVDAICEAVGGDHGFLESVDFDSDGK